METFKRPFEGIITHVKGRASCYKQDWTGALCSGARILAPTLYIFLAPALPVIAFDEERGTTTNGYPAPTSAGIFSPVNGHGAPVAAQVKKKGGDGKDLHMLVWSSSASPVFEGGIHVFRGGAVDYANELTIGFVPHIKDYDDFGRDEFSFGNRQVAKGGDREGPKLSKLGSSSTTELRPKMGAVDDTRSGLNIHFTNVK